MATRDEIETTQWLYGPQAQAEHEEALSMAPLYMVKHPGERVGRVVWHWAEGEDSLRSLDEGEPGASTWMPHGWAMRVAKAYKRDEPARSVRVLDTHGYQVEILDPRQTPSQTDTEAE